MALEVSPMAVVAHLDVFARHVRFPEDLFDGLPWDEAALRAHRGRIDWDPYAELLDRLGALCGSDEAIRKVGATMDETGPWIQLLLRSVVAPTQLYQFWARLVPNVWRALTLEVADLGDSRIEIRCAVRPGFRGCRTMILASVDSMATTTRRIGLAPCVIETFEVTPFLGRFRYRVPPSRTVAAQLSRRWDGLWSFLEEDAAALEHTLATINASRSQLEEYARVLDRIGEIGRQACSASGERELGTLICSVVTHECGYGGVRLCTRGEPIAVGGTLAGAHRLHPLGADGRDLGTLETWGTPRYADLLDAVVPWLVRALDALQVLDAERELARVASAQREALATLTADWPTWIVGPDGEVQWANPAGQLELAGDGALAVRLRGGGDAEIEVTAVDTTGIRVMQRRSREAEIALRRGRVAHTWGLTPAQTRVLELVARGQSNKEIAEALCVEEGTVEAHLSQVFRKSGCAGRTALVAAFWSA